MIQNDLLLKLSKRVYNNVFYQPLQLASHQLWYLCCRNRNTEIPVEQSSRQDSTYTGLNNKVQDPSHDYRIIGSVVPAETAESQYETLPGDARRQSILSGGPYVDLREEDGASATGNHRNSTGAVSNSNTYLPLRSDGQSSLFQEREGVTTVQIETDDNHDHDGATHQRTQSETTDSPTTDYREIADQSTTSNPTDYQKLSKEPEHRSPYVSMSRDESHVY